LFVRLFIVRVVVLMLKMATWRK